MPSTDGGKAEDTTTKSTPNPKKGTVKNSGGDADKPKPDDKPDDKKIIRQDTQEEQEIRREDTLYDIVNLQAFTSRKVEPEDLTEIKRLLTNEDYEFFRCDDPNVLFEKCCFNLTVSDAIESDRIVAAAFFDDKPVDPDLKKYSKTWKKTPKLQKMVPLNTLYLRLLVRSFEVHTSILLPQVVAFTFIACPVIEYIIVECPAPKIRGPFHFNKVVRTVDIHLSGRKKKRILIYDKEEMFPPLTIREGRENDLDDLAPLLPLDSETMMRDFGKAFLTDVIALGDKNNQSVVAEWNYEAVGIVSVSTDINYEVLNQLYHLEPFHGLHKPYPTDEVNVVCYDTRNVVQVPIDEILEDAQHTMDVMRGKRRRPEDPLPYTVEAEREECLAEYESDESAQKRSDEARRQGHLFGTSVSHDVIQYGLRSPSPVNSEMSHEVESARLENIKSIAEKLKAAKLGEEENDEEEEGDEDENENAEEEVIDEDHYTRKSDDVLKDNFKESRRSIKKEKVEKVEKVEKKVEKEKEAYKEDTRNRDKDEKFDPTALNLLDFIDEFIADEGDDEAEGDEGAEDEGMEDLQVLAEPKELAGSDESGGEIATPEKGVSSSGSESDSPNKPSKIKKSKPNWDEMNMETPGEDWDEEAEGGGSGTGVKDEGVKGQNEEEKDEAAEEEEDDEEEEAGGDRHKRSTRGSRGSKKRSGKSRMWQQNTTRSTGVPQHSMLSVANRSLIEAHHRSRGNAYSLAGTASTTGSNLLGHHLAFFQNKTEFQKRWSDDTFYLGRTGVDRMFTFDDKIELMKKVWEIYLYMKQEGLTFEAAKLYLAPVELSALEEADNLTKGNLLKFLTLLMPDETSYPFERYIKPKVPKYKGLPNGLVIKMLNIEKKFSLRSADMLREVFKFFPNREYLVVTVPQGGKEPTWLEHFVRVVPRIDCSFPNELFVVHKAYLSSKLKVRRGRIVDIHKTLRLLESLKDKDKILLDFKNAVCCKKYLAYVVEVLNHPNNPIVGMAVVADEMESQTYQINYQLKNHTYYNIHSPMEHVYFHHLIMLPIFEPFARTFTKEVMRLMKKTSCYQKIYPPFCENYASAHQSLLNNMDHWMPVTPRQRIHYNFLNLSNDSYDLERLPPPFVTDYTDPFAVIYFGKKFSFDQKINLNSRVVFVGASETTLACVEKMICSSFRAYKRLTIIDTFGLPGQFEESAVRDAMFALNKGGTSTSFRNYVEWVQRLGLQHWANIVAGTVTRINRDKKYVVVNKERIVPYDVLVLAPGRQFMRIDCPEPEINDPNFLAFKKKANRHKMQVTLDLSFKRDRPKPKNVFTLNSEIEAEIALKFIKNYTPFMKRKKILVFGAGLRCFSCIRALLLFGVEARRIVLIDTPNLEVEWEIKAGYSLTNTIRLPMEEELNRLGVHWVHGYEFDGWETCPISGLVKRSYFNSPTEKESKISFSTFAIFCFRNRRVNDDLVSALAETYILYQDGIVIDENFKTNDPDIYAAGPATTYKRILLSPHHDHMYFQAEEVGHKLAGLLINRIGVEGWVKEVETFEVPKFKRPFVRAIELIGGWHYMVMKPPGAPLHTRSLDPNYQGDDSFLCMCTTEIVTGSVNEKEDPHQKYFKAQLDDQSRIIAIECMSKRPFSPSNFIGLYGRHEVLLNKMMERLENGEVKDLYAHFCQPWFGTFCVDHWESFLLELQDLYKETELEGGGKIADFIRDYVSTLDSPESIHVDPNIIRNIWNSSGLKQDVELKFLAFLKFNKLSLPMYARNDYVEDLLEERTTSTLYHPRVNKY